MDTVRPGKWRMDGSFKSVDGYLKSVVYVDWKVLERQGDAIQAIMAPDPNLDTGGEDA